MQFVCTEIEESNCKWKKFDIQYFIEWALNTIHFTKWASFMSGNFLFHSLSICSCTLYIFLLKSKINTIIVKKNMMMAWLGSSCMYKTFYMREHIIYNVYHISSFDGGSFITTKHWNSRLCSRCCSTLAAICTQSIAMMSLSSSFPLFHQWHERETQATPCWIVHYISQTTKNRCFTAIIEQKQLSSQLLQCSASKKLWPTYTNTHTHIHTGYSSKYRQHNKEIQTICTHLNNLLKRNLAATTKTTEEEVQQSHNIAQL